MSPVAWNGSVVCHRHDIIGVDPAITDTSLPLSNRFNFASKLDAILNVRPWKFPGIHPAEPIVWVFNLPALFNFLGKKPVFVADTVAKSRHVQGGQ